MKFNVDIDAKSFFAEMKRIDRNVARAVERAMEDIVDELIRIASEITPFDKGILQKSHSHKINVGKNGIEASVEFSVKEGDFNYALWIHEGIYNYGSGTMRRAGTIGWSGKRYYAGRKYLERPLKGEQEAFFNHIAKEVRKAIGG